jgi:hypothetical protein
MMLGFWLVMRVLCVINEVELPLTLSVPLDLAVLEYLSERIFQRWFTKE